MRVFCDGSQTRVAYVFEGCQPIILDLPKKVTGNTGEYLAICYALGAALRLRRLDILVLSDSQLIIRQLNKKYLVKKEHLQKLAVKVWRLAKQFNSIEFKWIKRGENLSGIALEMAKRASKSASYQQGSRTQLKAGKSDPQSPFNEGLE